MSRRSTHLHVTPSQIEDHAQTYDHICDDCRTTLTRIALSLPFEEGMPDSDPLETLDDLLEQACDVMHDTRQFCGGYECVNAPARTLELEHDKARTIAMQFSDTTYALQLLALSDSQDDGETIGYIWTDKLGVQHSEELFNAKDGTVSPRIVHRLLPDVYYELCERGVIASDDTIDPRAQMYFKEHIDQYHERFNPPPQPTDD